MVGRAKTDETYLQNTVISFLFQNEKLSRNETRMDGDRSLRLAKALRNATQHNGTLFGNDVRTAYQLLARILQHESHQQGFDLAATREANFHEVRGGWTSCSRSLWDQELASAGEVKYGVLSRHPSISGVRQSR